MTPDAPDEDGDNPDDDVDVVGDGLHGCCRACMTSSKFCCVSGVALAGKFTSESDELSSVMVGRVWTGVRGDR